jgi:hypothetical protein
VIPLISSDTPRLTRHVNTHRKRWLVEEFFKALKTDRAAKTRQGRRLWRLLNTVSLRIPSRGASSRIRATARLGPDAPASRVVGASELQALRSLASSAKLPRGATARTSLAVAVKLGGHTKSCGEPGWLVLGRGSELLLDSVAGWRAAMKAMGADEGIEL